MTARRSTPALRTAALLVQLASAALSGATAAESSSPAASPINLADITLVQSSGALPLASTIRAHRLTVVLFVSSTCPCVAAHRARLAALIQQMKARDVGFVLVDSEAHRSDDVVPAVLAGVDVPIWRDSDARLARRLDARAATESFVFDATGSLRYRGGIDDDRKVLRPAPKEFLRDELIQLLDGTAPPFVTAKTLGCVLRLP